MRFKCGYQPHPEPLVRVGNIPYSMVAFAVLVTDWKLFQTYSKATVDHVQEALTHAQKNGKLATNIFEVGNTMHQLFT